MIKRRRRWLLVLVVTLLIATVQPAAAAPVSDGHVVVHTVQPDEDLFRIGLRYGVSVDALVRANGLADAHNIYAGQRLIIPLASGSTSGAAVAPATPVADGIIHIVQSGENLFRIGLRYGVSIAQLQAANQLSNINIFVGQKLRIPPAAAATASPSSTVLSASSPVPTTSGEAREIVVDLSEQQVYLYENGSLARTMIASTGVAATPTVLGSYRIYLRHPKQTMSGPGYYLPDVPYVQYFYQGYGFHGTYWHNNFGTPMSRGCVNLTIADAEWLYGWASIGTLVRVGP